MASEDNGSPAEAASVGVSKKAAKKAAQKAEKELRQQMAAVTVAKEEEDSLAANFGDLPFEALQSKEIAGRIWTPVSQLEARFNGETVLIRGRAHSIRGKGKIAFVIVREAGCSVQCVLSAGEHVSKGMLKFVNSINKESFVDVQGVVSVPDVSIEATSQQEGVQFVRVLQDTRLNNRVVDLRTPANQGIFRVQDEVSSIFCQFLRSIGFVGIHTPKLISGASEGGASVFKLEYMGQPACLAQSPQLYKQMCISADYRRVYEVGPVFRAEDSKTHRHLCEFTGLDFEMEIKEHYFEVLDVIDRLFVAIFDALNANCKQELQAINNQYPFEPLQYLRKTLRLTFAEGLEMLKEAGVEVDPLGDFNTETERRLGQLVKENYQTEFYILHRYPSAVRPYYTMPCFDDPNYSNSFDVFIRGEEIISGSQRIHESEFLTTRAQQCGIDVKSLSSYIDSFKYGAPPHGGAGIGLERVVMLFCALNNIRKCSMYPRDPSRLAP